MMRSMMLLAALGLALSAPSQAAPRLAKAQSYHARSVEPVSLDAGRGWRMELVSDRGAGAIVRIDRASGSSWYLGEASFGGWSQKDLAALYSAVLRDIPQDRPQTPQLG